MFEPAPTDKVVPLFPRPDGRAFALPELLYAICWCNAVPGQAGWRLDIPDEDAVSSIGLIPPGSRVAAYRLTRDASVVQLARLRNPARPGPLCIGRFDSVRSALATLSPLGEAAAARLDQTMAQVYPPLLRDGAVRHRAESADPAYLSHSLA